MKNFTYKKQALRIFSAVCVACALLFASFAAPVSSDNTEEASGSAQSGLRQIGASDKLKIYWDNDTQLLQIENQSGFVWQSAAPREVSESAEINDFWRTNLNAFFHFTYYNSAKTDRSNTLQSNSLSDGTTVTAGALKNGVALKFYISDLGIRLTVEVAVDKDSVSFTVPEASIKEIRDFKLVTLTLLPFFGSTGEDDGFVVYPDGSGAIHYYTGKPLTGASALRLPVYGSRVYDAEYVEALNNPQTKTASLPIFGAVKGTQGFLGIIEDEALEADIEYSPNGLSVSLERIAAVFTLRRTYTQIKPDIKGGTVKIEKLQSERVTGDRRLVYCFLPENSGYSGMANRYREYLTENGGLPERIYKNADTPLMLDLFGGITEERMLLDRYITMTDFDSAREILADLHSNGAEDLRANFIGWQSGGYGKNPAHFPAASKLGGNSGLKALNSWTQKQGITLTLQDNFTLAKEGSGGFNKRADCVFTYGSMLLSNIQEDLFLLNPAGVLKKFTEKILPKAKKLNVNGFLAEDFGTAVYADYSKSHTSSRAETRDARVELLRSARKALGYTSVIGANAFLFTEVDFLHKTPTEDSGYFITDEAIPLVQMVIHGHIPYSAEEPENLFYDSSLQRLKMLEYGAVPYFQLTKKSTADLIYTDYNFLFTAKYSRWRDSVLESVKTRNTKYKPLHSLIITEHIRLSEKLVRITYDDGSRLYLNYGGEAAQIDGTEIPPRDAVLIGGAV